MKIYLDHNACTPVDPRVLERFVETERAFPGNPSSVHASGRAARKVVEAAREGIASVLGVEPRQVLFVSGGTEANNLAVRGLGPPARPVLLAPIEHPSALRAAEHRGAVWWQVRGDATAVVTSPAEPVGLVCLSHAQNEVGTLQPVAAARTVADELGAPLHVDASQTLGRVDVSAVVRDADSVTLSVHKAGGLRGATVLIVKQPEHVQPLLLGGSQEAGLRPGTLSPAQAAATATAVELAVSEHRARADAMASARVALERELRTLEPTRITPAQAIPNTVMLLIGGVDGRSLMPALDLGGVECSQGSACSTGSPQPPRVLSCIGLTEHDARRCVRFSVSNHTSECDATEAGRRVVEVVHRLRTLRAARSIER